MEDIKISTSFQKSPVDLCKKSAAILVSFKEGNNCLKTSEAFPNIRCVFWKQSVTFSLTSSKRETVLFRESIIEFTVAAS